MSVTNPKFNPSGNPDVSRLKAAGLDLGNMIESLVPPGRRRSVALTHLETTMMWAVKAAIVGDNE